jgi:xanthine dehydrogenase YagS FAD-binding subunit
MLQPGDLLTAVRIPGTWAGKTFYFEKVRDRQVWDFALVNIASAIEGSGSSITRARMVVNGVSARPFRLEAVESYLAGKTRNEQTADAAADLAVQGAAPLRHNAYKVPLMKALVKRAIRGAGEWSS